MRVKRLLKKLYDVVPFHTDDDKRFEFYYRKNWLQQFDIMVYDIENKTNRWFMITAPVFYTFMGLDKDETIHTFKRNIDGGMKPKVANEFINKGKFTLISHKIGKYSGETVVAKISEFGPEDARQRVLLLKRVASVPEQDFAVLGIDTLEIPFVAINKFVKAVSNTYFKGIDLELEIELESDKEEENATN